MPLQTPLHPRTSALCESLRYKEWAGHFAVCSYGTHHEAEYFGLRNAVGLIDVSPLHKYHVVGEDAAAFLAWVATRDVCGLAPGRVTYTCFCDAEGKVIDDGTVANLGDARFRVTTGSPAFGWFERNRRGFSCHIEDASDGLAALALQGPRSRAVLEALVGESIGALPFFGVAGARIASVDVEISRTGYTGDLGYELWIPAEGALAVWDALVEAGGGHGLLPVGLDALDVTRIEAGYVLQDVDYFSAPRCLIESRKSDPFEIGLGFTVAAERDPFLGQAALLRARQNGSPWHLVGLEISWTGLEALYERYGLPPALSPRACRDPLPVYTGAVQVGQVTSSVWSPILKQYVALASVRSGYEAPGTVLRVEHTVEFERSTVAATVVRTPFYDPERKRA